VHADDEQLNAKFQQAARFLNLKEHKVGDKNIYGAGDTEGTHNLTPQCTETMDFFSGHLGGDHRYYVLDFSRAFPPEGMTHVNFDHFLQKFHPNLLCSTRKKS
jgi:hypothetical protein